MVEDFPGYAQQVYNGWVWVTRERGNTIEYGWSRGSTMEECIKKVEDAVRVHGINGAFHDDTIPDGEVDIEQVSE